MKLGAFLIVERVTFVVDHEVENEALGELRGLIKHETAICNVSAERHDRKVHSPMRTAKVKARAA